MNELGFNTRELATVLAALRLFQRTDSALSGPENDIASNSGAIEPLSNAEIDALCERLNVEPAVERDVRATEDLAGNRQDFVGRIDISAFRKAGEFRDWEKRNGISQEVRSLRAAVMDEPRFTAALQALQTDPAIDTAKAGLIARAYINKVGDAPDTPVAGEPFLSRDEAFAAITAEFNKWRDLFLPGLSEQAITSHLDMLQGAGTDEARFDLAFQALKSDPVMETTNLQVLASFYTGDGSTAYRTCEEALGAIEGEFYVRAQGQQQEQAQGHGR